jgi:hypothetical protein
LKLEQPKVLITGDIRLSVTESEAALHPITGHYSIQTAEMQEPLYILWHAEGQVLRRHGLSTSIAFDVHGARTGETRSYLVAVQVAESGEQGRVVLSGVFVQVVVTGDDPQNEPGFSPYKQKDPSQV